MEDLFAKLISNKKLAINDDPFCVEDFIDIKKYVSWDVVDEAIKSDIVHWEILNSDGKSKIPVLQEDKTSIENYVNAGYTFVVSRSAQLNDSLNSIASAILKTFHVSADIHIYGSKGKSGSFGPHADMPANLVIQVEGETEWIVYKNKVSNLLSLYYRDKNNKSLEPMIEHRAKPGDLIYVPSRHYHCAIPDSPRLSISIPCVYNPEVTKDDPYGRWQSKE